MLTWFQKQTPLFRGSLTFILLIGTGLILYGLGSWLTTGVFLDTTRLLNILFGAFLFGSISYWSAKHPSGVAEILTPLQHGLLTLAVLWSGLLLMMLLVWTAGWAEGESSLLIEITALMAAACALLAVSAYGMARRARTRKRDERNPETGNAPSG